jgi:tetratricopeptide (TPR) repeat protein
MTEVAVPLWQQAGDLAIRRFALPEALSHLRRGLSLAETLPPSRDRDLVVLALRSALGPTIVAYRGWAHHEVSSVLEPAWSLAEALQHTPGYVPILNALCMHNMSADKLALGLDWALKLVSIGAELQDYGIELVGHRIAASVYFWHGEFTAARRHGDIVQAGYDAERDFPVAQLTNTDPLTGEGIYRAQYLWMLGYPDQAVAVSDAKDEHARRRNHPFDLPFALTLGAQVFDFLHDADALLQRAMEAERVGANHGIAVLLEGIAEISRGIAWLRAGRAAESAVQLEKATARLAATGHRIWIRYLKALQAEARHQAGERDRALALIVEAIAEMEAGEDRAHYAEILRLKGLFLFQGGDLDAAEVYLRRAIEVAQRQQAKSWELRAATTLAELLAERGDRSAAQALLAPVYGWFTEGFGTRDLRQAKALLETLAG